MGQHGKRYRSGLAAITAGKLYPAEESLSIVHGLPAAKYDETVVASIRLGIDAAKSDQSVRGGVVLPKGLGKSRRVLVFAKGEKVKEASDAGADFSGLDDLIAKIGGGWVDFDVAVATPDVMGSVAKIAKILGPRGLMPNPKTGTVTFDLAQAVREAKAGKVEFRADKGGNVHVAIGKKSFPVQDLHANFEALMEAVLRSKPASSKGIYLKAIYVSPSAGPAVPVDPAAYRR